MFAFPESPKFLLEHGDTKRALEALEHMFTQNTGYNKGDYPVSIKNRNKQKLNAIFDLTAIFV